MSDTELIRDFVNTRELLDPVEELGSPNELGAWLAAHNLSRDGKEPSALDLRRAVELREALRALLLGNNGVDLAPDRAAAVLDQAARRARIELCFEECRGALVPAAAGVSAALGRITIAVHRAMDDGSWSRLKACRAADCQWAFIDTAKNQSRAWCSMSSCGNREKARHFRQRQRGGDPASSHVHPD